MITTDCKFGEMESRLEPRTSRDVTSMKDDHLSERAEVWQKGSRLRQTACMIGDPKSGKTGILIKDIVTTLVHTLTGERSKQMDT